jgi:Sec-independent protein translocase protein TatA
MQNIRIRGLLVIFIFIAIVVGCEKAKDMAESAKKAATKAQTLIMEKVSEVSDSATKVKDNVKQVAVNVKQVSVEHIYEVNKQIKNIVNETIQQVIVQIKAWIYKTLEPVFPWLFIILFLLLFVALKLAVPLSNLVQIQSALAVISYAVAFLIFTKIGLLAFAIKGSVWFLVPFIISCLVVWFVRNVRKTKTLSLKSRVMSEAGSQIG